MESIGLCLSGGGVRAMAFHAGTLKWLAENEKLEHIRYLSTVSGGSLFVGLLFHCSGNKWPSSSHYRTRVFPYLEQILTEKSLQKKALLDLVLPWNWKFIFNRANLISKEIENFWGIKSNIDDLPAKPIWTINGTCGENGRRFRIKKGEIGDYEIGYSKAANFSLSDAMAISAAFPVGIGPLSLKTINYKWNKKINWDSKEQIPNYMPPYKILHIYDGGVYDNLGLEPVFDIGSQKIKKQIGLELNNLIVSDASTPLSRKKIPHVLNPLRVKLLIDIMMDQVRSLRVRSFVNFLINNKTGLYIQLGADPQKLISTYAKDQEKENILKEYQFLNKHDLESIKMYPTTLNKMSKDNFNKISRNGFEVAMANALINKNDI